MVWDAALHARFVSAVSSLGIANAVPAGILGLMHAMGDTELTYEQINSHLQKYKCVTR